MLGFFGRTGGRKTGWLPTVPLEVCRVLLAFGVVDPSGCGTQENGGQLATGGSGRDRRPRPAVESKPRLADQPRFTDQSRRRPSAFWPRRRYRPVTVGRRPRCFPLHCPAARPAESMVYITGMNRIRHFFAETAPASRPYFVLPIYDDGPSTEASELGWASTPEVRAPAPDGSDARHRRHRHGRRSRRLRRARCATSWKRRGLDSRNVGLSDRADCPVRLLAAFAGQHPCSDPSDPPHAERADQCAVLTARIGQ